MITVPKSFGGILNTPSILFCPQHDNTSTEGLGV